MSIGFHQGTSRKPRADLYTSDVHLPRVGFSLGRPHMRGSQFEILHKQNAMTVPVRCPPRTRSSLRLLRLPSFFGIDPGQAVHARCINKITMHAFGSGRPNQHEIGVSGSWSHQHKTAHELGVVASTHSAIEFGHRNVAREIVYRT